jgi:hypothetical protein
MASDLDHNIAGPESGTVDGTRYVDDDAIGPIGRDNGPVRWCIEPHRDSDHTEQHKDGRDNCRCPAGEVGTPGAPLGRLYRRRRAHDPILLVLAAIADNEDPSVGEGSREMPIVGEHAGDAVPLAGREMEQIPSGQAGVPRE